MVVLVFVAGQVISVDNGRPLPGAYLQILGTPYSTYSDNGGYYKLSFDRALVANCRTQAVRVTAPGYSAADLLLGVGVEEHRPVASLGFGDPLAASQPAGHEPDFSSTRTEVKRWPLSSSARTSPSTGRRLCRAITSPRPSSSPRSWRTSSTGAGSVSGARIGSPTRRLLRPGDRPGERHRPQGSRGRLPGLLQRLPAPGHPALRGAHRAILRRPSSAPTTPGRTVSMAASSARPRPRRSRTSTRRLAALLASRSRPGRASSSSTSPRSRSRSTSPARRSWAGFARFNLPNLKVARTIDYDVKSNWKLIVPELLGVLPLRPGASDAGQAHARRPAARMTSPRVRSLGGYMVTERGHREHDDERPRLRRPGGRSARRGHEPGVLLLDLPEHAAQPAPRLRDVPHPVAQAHDRHPSHLRLALPSRDPRRPDVQPGQTESSSGT